MRKRAIDHPLHIIVSGHMTISIDMPALAVTGMTKGWFCPKVVLTYRPRVKSRRGWRGPQAPTPQPEAPITVPGNQPFSAKVNRLLPEMMETYCTPSTR